MYFERDVGGHISLIYIDHVYSHGNIYIVASENDGQLILEEGYTHDRDCDVVEAFLNAYGLERKKIA